MTSETGDQVSVAQPSADDAAIVEALARALTDADPTCVPSSTWRAVTETHREYRREHARALLSLGLRLPTCDLCGDVLVWHEGNGGQWIGAVPPRDWMTCHGSVDGPRHTASTPPDPHHNNTRARTNVTTQHPPELALIPPPTPKGCQHDELPAADKSTIPLNTLAHCGCGRWLRHTSGESGTLSYWSPVRWYHLRSRRRIKRALAAVAEALGVGEVRV